MFGTNLDMREIIHIQVGSCGNRIGNAFWEKLFQEHGISRSGNYTGDLDAELEKIDVYFHEEKIANFVPRSVMVDLEPGVIDIVRGGAYGRLFRQENFLNGVSGAGNNWAKGFYTEGQEIAVLVPDVVRKEMERCDSPQGFQLCFSLGGGTGSGLGASLLRRIQDEWPDKILSTFAVFPSPKVCDTVVEPYNVMLSSNELINQTDQTFCIDNEALYNISFNALKIKRPVYEDLNHLVSLTLSGLTSCFRFPSHLNEDMRKLATNLIPFPVFHFFISGLSPLTTRGIVSSQALTTEEMIQEMFDARNMMTSCNPMRGRYMSVAAIFRGPVPMIEVDEEILKMQDKKRSNFADWIPHNVKTSHCEIPTKGLKTSGTLVGNNTAIQEMFRRISEQFHAIFKRRAFLHWYTGEGMDLSEFTEAEENVNQLITSYEEIQEDFDPEDEAPELAEDIEEKPELIEEEAPPEEIP